MATLDFEREKTSFVSLRIAREGQEQSGAKSPWVATGSGWPAYSAKREGVPRRRQRRKLLVPTGGIVPRDVVYESVISGPVGLTQLTTADSRAG